jgi:hypothetical protein
MSVPLREAPIYRRPDHVLYEWYVREFTNGVSTVLGFDYRTHDMLCSSNIEFFDSENAVVLDSEGVVWLLLEGGHLRAESHKDRTADCAALIAQRRDKRHVPPLTTEQKQLLRKLTSKK